MGVSVWLSDWSQQVTVVFLGELQLPQTLKVKKLPLFKKNNQLKFS